MISFDVNILRANLSSVTFCFFFFFNLRLLAVNGTMVSNMRASFFLSSGQWTPLVAPKD